MDFTALISLFLLTFFNALAPGPGVLLVCATSLQFGWRKMYMCVAGMLIGTTLLFSTSVAVVLGLMSIHPSVYEALRWFGVAILILLALALWPMGSNSTDRQTRTLPVERHVFGAGFMLALCQPMSLIFMLAVVPQFLRGDTAKSASLLAVLSVVLIGTGLAMSLAGVFANRARPWFSLRYHVAARAISLCFFVFAALLVLDHVS